MKVPTMNLTDFDASYLYYINSSRSDLEYLDYKNSYRPEMAYVDYNNSYMAEHHYLNFNNTYWLDYTLEEGHYHELFPPSTFNATLYNCLLIDGLHPECQIYTHNISHPRFLQASVNRYTVPVCGYLIPLLVVFTLVTNTLLCALLGKKQLRNPTNAMLAAIAVCDMGRGVFLAPCFVYFFAMGHYQEWMPYAWCHVYEMFTEFIPAIFHTASIWLTVALALQRYICVCHSSTARQWCTMGNVTKAVTGIFGAAILSHLARFFEHETEPITLQKRLDPSQEMEACIWSFSSLVNRSPYYYFGIYHASRALLIHTIPCVILSIVSVKLMRVIRDSQRRRRLLNRDRAVSREGQCLCLRESTRTTLMMMAMLLLCLLVEIPQAVLFILIIVQNSHEGGILEDETVRVASLFMNLLAYISYPFMFFICCTMSKKLRDTFKEMVSRRQEEVLDMDEPVCQSLNVPNDNDANNGDFVETAV